MKVHEKIIIVIIGVLCVGAITSSIFAIFNSRGVQEQIRKINDSYIRIEQLQSAINKQNTRIEQGFLGLGDSLSTVGANLTSIRTTISGLNHTISGIRTSVSGLYEEFQNFKSGLPELENLARESSIRILEAQRILSELTDGND